MPLPDWWRSIISIYASTCFGYQQPQQVKNRLAPLKSILASKAQTGFWENIPRNAARLPHQNALNGVFTSNSLAAFLPQDFPPLSNYKWLRNARLETPVPRDFLSCQLDCPRIETVKDLNPTMSPTKDIYWRILVLEGRHICGPKRCAPHRWAKDQQVAYRLQMIVKSCLSRPPPPAVSLLAKRPTKEKQQ